MILKKECSSCSSNYSGTCNGHGKLYKYGERITDDTKGCTDWTVNFEYFLEIMREAPWYILKQYSKCAMSYNDVIRLIEKDNKGIPIQVNIYDVIQKIYGLSLIDLAEILNVSIGVLMHAKNRNTPSKRVIAFSNKLYISKQLFTNKVTTADFNELVKSKIQFFSTYNQRPISKKIPEWKEKLINDITDSLVCSRALALKVVMISDFKWEIGIPLDKLNENEQALMDFLNTSRVGKECHLTSVEYIIDAFCQPRLSYEIKKETVRLDI